MTSYHFSSCHNSTLISASARHQSCRINTLTSEASSWGQDWDNNDYADKHLWSPICMENLGKLCWESLWPPQKSLEGGNFSLNIHAATSWPPCSGSLDLIFGDHCWCDGRNGVGLRHISCEAYGLYRIVGDGNVVSSIGGMISHRQRRRWRQLWLEFHHQKRASQQPQPLSS